MVSILDVAKSRLEARGRTAEDSLTGGDFESVGLQILGGCEVCAASIAAYNAYPSKSGFWRCRNCIDGTGYETVAEFEAWVVREERLWAQDARA